MKKMVLLAATVMLMIGCKDNKKEDNTEGAETFVEAVTNDDEQSYETFGDEIVAEEAFTKEEMLEKYKTLKPGDTIDIKFKSTIKDVCQKKGCWMAMELPDEKESFVKFKDYGFFVPLNAAEQEAVVRGKAFVSEISVDELKHYAKDGGKSQEEIDLITEPEITYGFMADGVLIKK